MRNVFYVFLVTLFFTSCEKIVDDEDIDTNPDTEIPDGFRISTVTTDYHKLYGAPGNNDDELTSGMVADAAGNIYFSLNNTKDIMITKLNADGSLAWAKAWDGNYRDRSPDSGENAETGGTANSISIDSDGFIYVSAAISDVSQNNIHSALILKLDPSNGAIVWQKLWKHEWPTASVLAYMDAQAYGIDASADYVYLTGADGSNRVFVVALDKSNGSLFFQYALDIINGTKDRGYVLKPDALGNLFVGGVTGSYAYLAKITSANTASPIIDWVKKVELGYGSRFNAIDIDTENNIYLSCDRRGAQTFFSIIKLDGNASLLWGKTFPGKNEDRNNTHVVRALGDAVYAGGRISEAGLDTEFGDGLLLKLDKNNGSLLWSGIYFSGNSDEEKAEHRIKGIAESNGKLLVVGQVYSSNYNSSHFYGDWLASEIDLIDFLPLINPFAYHSFETITTGEIRDASGNYMDANSSYVLQNAKDKNDGTPPDGDAFIMKIDLN